MSTHYKDFSDLNSCLAKQKLSARSLKIRSILNHIQDAKSAPDRLPSDWARSYAGVMVLKYDQNGNPSDVTPDVTGPGLTVPNSLISNAISRFKDAKSLVDIDLEEIGNVVSSSTTVNFQNMKVLDNDAIHIFGQIPLGNDVYLRVATNVYGSQSQIGFGLFSQAAISDRLLMASSLVRNPADSDLLEGAFIGFINMKTSYTINPIRNIASSVTFNFNKATNTISDIRAVFNDVYAGTSRRLNFTGFQTVPSGSYYNLLLSDWQSSQPTTLASSVDSISTITPYDLIGEDADDLDDMEQALLALNE